MQFLHDLAEDLATHWVIYLSMPFIAAAIGYVTKLVAVEMMFRPLEFVGIPPYLGWQGIIPRNAARMAQAAVGLLMDRLIDPKELIEQINVDDLVDKMGTPLNEMIEQITRDLMKSLAPNLWVSLPEAAQSIVLKRVKESVPALLAQFKGELKDNLDAVVNLRTVAVNALVRDKSMTVKMIRTVGQKEMQFIVRIGIPFGFFLGIIQAATWALTHSPWIMPLFGAFTGLFTDWLALQMIFRPKRPHKYFGFLKWQGLFHKRRDEVTHDYTQLISNEILTPANLIEDMLTGPRSDRFISLLTQQIQTAVDTATGIAKPFVAFAIGSEKYAAVKHEIADAVLHLMRTRTDELGSAAADAMQLPALLESKMKLMTDDEFEGLLRPAFKQDEWKLVTVGAVLGYLIGELQVLLLLE
ncbi:DUF445 family protein [Mycobacterium sp. CBMA271]|uniref:DUF445 domain-containing protein n=1 Tax=unclassified Mycobacteroides TaxID=2618759 RepID=UPI0012DE5ED6|nr:MULTISPECIES: DUF445 family protein [unclassified Mycobacteroides]MUM16056.1 hypothetical protein [Mycobacteroides sp. CBMA 326]MUM22446.1 DUF445 family protein [Mycobacteroides sp. CBMA 271]